MPRVAMGIEATPPEVFERLTPTGSRFLVSRLHPQGGALAIDSYPYHQHHGDLLDRAVGVHGENSPPMSNSTVFIGIGYQGLNHPPRKGH